MKKVKFYSLVNGENGKPIAKEWTGYTDNIFNYYKTEQGTWHAIEKNTGLSVGNDTTRKTLMERVTTPEHLQRVNERITKELITRFNNCIAAMEKELQACS